MNSFIIDSNDDSDYYYENNNNKERIEPYSSSLSLPLHTFPSSTVSLVSNPRDFLEEEISTILINSDSSECNENFSIFIKCILDNVYNTSSKDKSSSSSTTIPSSSYEEISYYALKLLTSNLFVKNFQFCVGKILAFLNMFTQITQTWLEETEEVNDQSSCVKYESECLKEFLCITLLLLLKIKNSEDENTLDGNDSIISTDSASTTATATATDGLKLIDIDYLFQTLSQFHIMSILAEFITTEIVAIDQNQSKFVILKFSCDIIFEYFYRIEILSDIELNELINSANSNNNNKNLISTLVQYLLHNENFNNYDLDADDFNNEDKLIAYEELKLLLLINEQFLMKSYNTNNKNLVFDELMMGNITNGNLNNITGFINLLIYHLNREESHIIKILILKFLYLVFTSSSTCKLIYLNDLKILIDILLRELNDLDYNDNIVLTMTYLRVLYPILMFSELCEINGHGYKSQEILETLRNIIINSEIKSVELEEELSISKLAVKCMNVKWLKKSAQHQDFNQGIVDQSTKPAAITKSQSTQDTHSSEEDEEEEDDKIKLNEDINTSKESLANSFTRVASVRASSRSDYHKHTTVHNIERKNSMKSTATNSKTTTTNYDDPKNDMIMENNGNIFLSKFSKMSINDNHNRNIRQLTNNTSMSDSLLYNSRKNSQSKPFITTTTNNNNNNRTNHNLLDLPSEYLISKPLPKLPIPEKRQNMMIYDNNNNNSSTSSLNSNSSLKQKALKKKAPPPPPPPPRRRK
ncbi:conserved hypothetical protein [Candida dubliniensis CD36]|uniref:SPIN90/Ldb17 leucine-rich domain-containing protein n=1 Tax=Candida dubliniensis (strain CD36 / ATCC MYA-646 / CBS 7987 / NCPF 3949 / NRRL Y-17841) TaxID=573826 RepID=B9WKQ6_CANDC|nr:conserved hypothetical protein [Candida dubliniensis CD36]CAX39605.1 conserved hypothetical protein [Candida dubliniensis CD36]